LKWIKRNKKKERELAQKRQKELESRDNEVFGEYTEREHLFSCLNCGRMLNGAQAILRA